MTKQTRGNRNGRKGDPNQDVQPLLGWLAALLVVVIVVVAVAMGMERTTNQRNGAAEVRMTPLVGGMEMPVATQTGAAAAVAAAAEITPMPAAISETTGITMVNVITATDPFTLTGEMTPTATLTATSSMTMSTEMSITESVAMTPTTAATATEAATPAATATAEVAPTVAPTATAWPTATARPTAIVNAPVFAVGDRVVASQERVSVYADASLAALVLDSFGAGVELEVVDPSGDFDGYPVVADGHGWARVRATDGLVGWVMTDAVEVP